MWDKATGDLYFWRTQLSGEFTVSLALYRMTPDGGEPELVRDLTDTFSHQLIWYNYAYWFMDGPSAVSPDASQVVLLVNSYDTYSDTSADGLWLVDLTDEQSAPQHLGTVSDFQTASPVWLALPPMPTGLSWTADGKGVVVVAFSQDTHVPMRVFYYVDVSSGTITPVVDFSDVPDMETLHTTMSEDGVVLRYYSPWTGVLSPLGNQLLMINDLGGVQGVMAAPLPPTGELPKLIYQAESNSSTGETRSSAASDGKVIAFSVLFTVEAE
jgi:hypothetical protein